MSGSEVYVQVRGSLAASVEQSLKPLSSVWFVPLQLYQVQKYNSKRELVYSLPMNGIKSTFLNGCMLFTMPIFPSTQIPCVWDDSKHQKNRKFYRKPNAERDPAAVAVQRIQEFHCLFDNLKVRDWDGNFMIPLPRKQLNSRLLFFSFFPWNLIFLHARKQSKRERWKNPSSSFRKLFFSLYISIFPRHMRGRMESEWWKKRSSRYTIQTCFSFSLIIVTFNHIFLY